MIDSVHEAMEVIKQAMIDDSPIEQGSYAHSWHCNIAMMCYDAIEKAKAGVPREFQIIDSHAIGNDAASRFMKLCFGVDTKQ
tara:strand:+ start:571 stop:816 length:246 start_codon:yes stop_codon:yes gene_type:complete